jgi:hypothetical protein
MRKLGEGGLMGKLLWSAQAEADLGNIPPDIADQIRSNAEDTLPDIQPCTGRTPQGIMCHRGITHEQEREGDWNEQEDLDGIQAWGYYLFYREVNPEGFEVLAVLSTHQIANMWGHIILEPPPDADDEQ